VPAYLSTAPSALNAFFYDLPRARGLTLGFNLPALRACDRITDHRSRSPLAYFWFFSLFAVGPGCA
jgi:hypothetical protein